MYETVAETDALQGMRTLSVATVTARGEPRISAVDGHLLHAKFVFTTAGSAAKARQLRARPGGVSDRELARLRSDRGAPGHALRQLAVVVG
ncbi:MAG: pyridoxamine 5'-phosphate oxidase family protein [Mycobacteriales bacterium]